MRHAFAPLAVVACLAPLFVPTEAPAANIATALGTPTNQPDKSENGGFAGCTGPEVECLHRVDLHTVAPQHHAVCNDGTPASFYIREGSTDPDKWIIDLEGGALCMDEVTCEQRWNGTGVGTPYNATDMSNDWDFDGVIDRPEHGRKSGLLSTDAANAFAGWTHVFVPYCSSDTWQGRADDVDLNTFTIDARGHTILRAVRGALRKNTVDPSWTSVDGAYVVPDLDLATEVIFSGTSAGGGGALQTPTGFSTPWSTPAWG